MENEPPWIETTSEWRLKENMTFNVDIFLKNDKMGLRFEDGIRVGREKAEELSSYRREIICL